MIFRALHKLGLPSDVFYLAALGSIAASILLWRSRSDEDPANAERLGIFVGLWAPSFMLLGSGLQTVEASKGLSSDALESATRTVEHGADSARKRAEAATGR